MTAHFPAMPLLRSRAVAVSFLLVAAPGAAILRRIPTGRRVMSMSTDYDEEQNRCCTTDCVQDPNDGEGWDGFCGACADALA